MQRWKIQSNSVIDNKSTTIVPYNYTTTLHDTPAPILGKDTTRRLGWRESLAARRHGRWDTLATWHWWWDDSATRWQGDFTTWQLGDETIRKWNDSITLWRDDLAARRRDNLATWDETSRRLEMTRQLGDLAMKRLDEKVTMPVHEGTMWVSVCVTSSICHVLCTHIPLFSRLFTAFFPPSQYFCFQSKRMLCEWTEVSAWFSYTTYIGFCHHLVARTTSVAKRGLWLPLCALRFFLLLWLWCRASVSFFLDEIFLNYLYLWIWI